MITRWSDPFRDLQTFQNQMNRLLTETFGGPGVAGRDEGVSAAWAPPVDIAENKDALTFTVELPGFRQEDITLNIENGVLTLEGERRFEKKTEEKSWHRVERSYGRFIRSFSLPVNVDAEKVAASLNEGVLTIDVPKREETKPKSIPIASGKKAIDAGPAGRK